MRKMLRRCSASRFVFTVCLLFPLFSFYVFGSEGPLPNVPRVDSKVRVDGVMDEDAWQKALKLELDYEVNPGENIKPPVRTEVFFLYSKSSLYVAFRCYDPDPSSIRARLTDRDKITGDDLVGITLDTFNAQRRAYTFMCNAFGIQNDMLETNTSADDSWDAIWESAGKINDEGYVVEMAIPFRALNFQRKKEEQVWGLDAVRSYPRNLPHFIGLIPRDRGDNCYLCQLAKVKGFKGAVPGRNIEIAPSLSGVLTQEREQFPDGKFQKKDDKLEPGVTAMWGFTPNMTLSATVNPDFSQVEADVAQLDINTQYALQYPEKRPFFLEGINIFRTRMPIVYTRTLADPDWGIKLTGKEGPHTVGFYSVRDSLTNFIFPASRWTQRASEPMNTIGSVLRYRYDVGKASTVGVLVTDREGDDYYNRVVGGDVYWRFSAHKQVSVQFLGSQTRYPDQLAADNWQEQGKFSGTALDFNFRHSSRNFGYYLFYQQATPDFRADLGFMPQVGYRNVTSGMIYAWHRNPGHWFTFINVVPQVQYEVDFNDELIYKSFNVNVNYTGPLQTSISLWGYLGKREYLGNIYDNNYMQGYFEIQPTGSLTFAILGIFGDHIDFENGRGGSRILLNPTLLYKFGLHFSLALDHTFERFTIDEGRLYTANVTYLKAVYQFSRRAFLRAILQYIDYDFNSKYYLDGRDPEYKHFFTQILFSYKINPRTVLFLGYSDDHYGFSFIPMTQNNRTFFLKLGYAFML